MKIGIITITIGINYGNRLQNYALQEVLNRLGATTNTFENIYKEKNIFEQIKRNKILKQKGKIFALKLKRFDEFNKKYINMSGKVTSYYVSKRLNKKYDYFICGSDQIWNPLFSGNTGTNFLTFADKSKRIAYAPSFGVSYIPDKRVNEYKRFINDIKYLSCREKKGIEIIKDITNREASLVLDPTLLLNHSDWNKVAEITEYAPKEKYLLTYFLGTDKSYKKYITDLANKNNLKVFNIMDMSDIEKFSTDPSEFLYLIKNAEIICTDSFHGTIFSIIYQKPFITFNRECDMENMNSRIDSLFELLSIPNRNFKILREKEIFNLNYQPILENLDREKINSINYLKESLNIRGNHGNM